MGQRRARAFRVGGRQKIKKRNKKKNFVTNGKNFEVNIIFYGFGAMHYLILLCSDIERYENSSFHSGIRILNFLHSEQRFLLSLLLNMFFITSFHPYIEYFRIMWDKKFLIGHFVNCKIHIKKHSYPKVWMYFAEGSGVGCGTNRQLSLGRHWISILRHSKAEQNSTYVGLSVKNYA